MTPGFAHNCMCTSVGTGKPIIKSLMKYRNKIAPYWRNLGIQLLPEKYADKLDVIQANHPNKVEDCCDEMFHYWLKVDTEATWNKLIDALEDIQQNETAAKIRKDNLKGNLNYTVKILVNTE